MGEVGGLRLVVPCSGALFELLQALEFIVVCPEDPPAAASGSGRLAGVDPAAA